MRPAPARSWLALPLTVLLCGHAHAQLLRCESAAGAVTYANGNCPPGTTLKREVPPAPPLSEADRKRAESQAKAEANRARQLEQAERAEAQQREKARAAEAKRAQERERNCRKLAPQLQQAEDALSKGGAEQA